MDYYISKTPNKMNNYGQILTKPIPESLLLPNEFVETYLQYKGYVKLTLNDIDEIVKIEPNLEEFNEDQAISANLEQINSFEEEYQSLKQELSDSDYKIIKCMEAFLGQFDMPYDYLALIDEREQKRTRINELEKSIAKKEEYIQQMKEFGDKHPDKKSTIIFAPEK